MSHGKESEASPGTAALDEKLIKLLYGLDLWIWDKGCSKALLSSESGVSELEPDSLQEEGKHGCLFPRSFQLIRKCLGLGELTNVGLFFFS